MLLGNVNFDLKVSIWGKCFELLRGLEWCKHPTTTKRGVQEAYLWRDICRFMLKKFLKLTPKLSKLFPIFDISGETMCSYTTNRDRSTFLKLQRLTWFQVFAIFSVPKVTSRTTPETRKPLVPHQESQKIIFLFFSGKVLWWRSELQLAKLLLSSRNQL